MKTILINNVEYELIKNYKDSFNEEELIMKYTDYFDSFDYILGDYSYNKLRLKGFCDKNNSILSKINDYSDISDYIANFCSYGCGYYILKKSTKNN